MTSEKGRLEPSPMIGSPAGHLSELIREGPPAGWSLAVAESVDSTNRWARRVLSAYSAKEVAEPCVFVAWEQTRGRGRLGRSWSSPAGNGLYASLLLPRPSAEELMVLPLVGAVALCRCLNRHLGSAARLKWPNDVMIGRRKLAGVLVESMISGDRPRGAVVGFGINYEPPSSPPPADRAYACDEGVPHERLPELTFELLSAVASELRSPIDAGSVLTAYREMCAHSVGDPMRFRAGGQVVEGVFRGFDGRGHLRLESDGKERLMAAGDLVE